MKTKIVLSVMLTMIVSGLLAQDFWTQLPNFPGYARSGAIAVAVGDKAYVGFGSSNYGVLNDFWEFNPGSGVWTQKAPLPAVGRWGSIAFTVGGKIYAGTGVTGRSVHDDMYQYDPVTNLWTSRARYPAGPRYLGIAFTIGDKAYAGSGKIYDCYNASFDFWEYDFTSDTWTRKADIGDATNGYKKRSAAVAFSINSKGYIGLGAEGYDTRVKDLWEFDPTQGASGKWTRKADLPSTPRLAALAFTTGNRAFAGLGAYYSLLTDFWEYIPSSDSWQLRNNNVANIRSGGSGFSIGNKGYVLFGQNTVDFVSDVWEYCPGIEIKFPENQFFCFDNSNNYVIPLTKIISECDPLTISYTIEGATQRSGSGYNASGVFNPGISTINWLADDGKGHSISSSTVVTIDYPISISISDQYAVNPGGEMNTIYIGYGPTSLTYQALVTGGTPFENGTYQYAWSTGETTSAITVDPSVVGLYNYVVTVTDKLGCTQSQSIMVNVIDVRCGKNMDKVELCKTPPGNPNKTTLVCINKDDVANQLNNGSKLSVCSPVVEDFLSGDDYVTLFPNPNKGTFNVMVTNIASTWCEVRIMDRNGMTVDSRNASLSESGTAIPFDLSLIPKGLYYVKVSSSEGVKMYKVLIE